MPLSSKAVEHNDSATQKLFSGRSESMAAKRLVIVVDGTAAMGPYWSTIVSDYLEKIIRYFCGQSRGQEHSGQIVELGVVMYKAHDGKGLKVQRSGWSRDMEKFIEWLLAFDFEGCGQDNAAIAEGLADALGMFPKPANRIEAGQYFLGERHCILVSASNPYPIPSQLELPKISDGFCGVETYSSMTDAKTVAEMFIQCFVSLSVISPKKFPKLREIYNAGNESHNGTDPSLYNAKHPQFLILLSEKFLEAHAALYHCETMSTSSINSAVAVGTNSVPMNSNFRPARSGLPQDQNNSPAGNIPTETSTVPAVSQDWCVPPHDFSTSIPISGQTSSLSYSFKEEITEEEIMRALSPEKFTLSQNTSTTNPTSVCGGTPPEIMTSAADAGENSGGHSIMSTVKENPHDDTSVFDWRSLLRATQSTESTSKHLCSITSASGNLNNSKPAELGSTSTKEQGPFKSNEPQGVTSQALAGTSESLQSTTDSSFMSSSFISGISQPEILQATYAGIHSPHFSMLSPMAKSEALLGTSQTTQTSASSFTSNTSKLSGNLRTMQPLASLRRTIGNNRLQSKKRQRGQLGVSSHRGRSVSIVERSQHISGGTEISAAIDLEHNYVMAWEGDISAKKKDKVIIVRRLKAYQKKSAPETLTADWPQTLQIVREIPQRLINKTRPYDGHADYMIFEASNDHRVYEQFRKKELGVRIDLPSQTLIFTPTGAPCRFIGTLFPGDCPLYKSCEQEQNDQATADESAMNETD
ncbi:mediator of RNA polymerase II transcription subunit 25 isoform X3 [Quercus suber]|uniref:mediator of RNA polymerase II transcription subunit 25 isoform X3 n=1 Tax=Quercus suber TaxID=58331 RepID=UPI000CE1AA5F|nr:mediator of RNA polymerase II transcription subunit 25-like isoform X3 [Quercus suber]